MSVRLGQIFCWIATILTLSMGALALASSIAALVMFAFVVYFLVFQIGMRIGPRSGSARFLWRSLAASG